MKKMLTLVLALALVASLAGCGGGVPQSDFDALKSERDAVVAERDAVSAERDLLQSEIDAAKLELQKAEIDYAALVEENDGLKQQINEIAEGQQAAAVGGTVDADNGVLVYEDDYVTITYLGCEIERSDENMVFYVKNKTDVELTFQAETIAIDGESLGFVFGSDSIAAQSKGKIRFETQEPFPTMSPTVITGTIDIIDFSKSLFGKQSYEISFVNLEVK